MSKNDRDTPAEGRRNGETAQPSPGSPPLPTDTSAETYQENTTPVQAFTSPVVHPATENRVRLGRPPRVAPAEPRETAGDTP